MAEFQPISPNPFIVGNPVRDPNMFFGRTAEFEEIQKRFLDAHLGSLLIFCGERRSGKTSILFQILQGRLGEDFIPVLIDMQSMAIDSESDFLRKIAKEIAAAIDPNSEHDILPDFARSSKPSALFMEFVERALAHAPNKKPILLVDEYELLETKIDAGVLSDDTLHILSHLMENHAVFMVFTGSEHLEQRRKPYWKILGRALHKRISYLSRQDAEALITRPVAGRVDFSPGAVDSIYRLTAGQPFYTQGICLYLVDALNEAQTNVVGDEILSQVIDRIVDNPFPQMLFLWDGFDRDEKLVLALLAESLEDADDEADVDRVFERLRAQRYPLPIGRAEIATTLEQLFKKEFLLKGREGEDAYSFRMDVWRMWVQRMHSVWQVIRELDMPLRSPRPWWRRRPAQLLAAAAILVAVGLGAREFLQPQEQRSNLVASPVPMGRTAAYLRVAVDAEETADIYLDGRLAGRDSFEGVVAARDSHELRISAPAHRDTTLNFTAAEEETLDVDATLVRRLGVLTVRSTPDAARVLVDGEERGLTPLRIAGLPLGIPHRLRVVKQGYGQRDERVELAEASRELHFDLNLIVRTVFINVRPSGTLLRVGDQPARAGPGQWQLPLGGTRIVAESPGYVSVDTTVQVGQETSTVEVALRQEAKGAILVFGNDLAAIWIDGVRVTSEGRSSGTREFEAGEHTIRVEPRGGEPLEQVVQVAPAELVTFDYSSGRLSRTPHRGSK